ncbi:hypothetical protein [Flagellimonas sp.]|uniref:hypothetical protein n=1 Tax=Flagellimonas sp. TaxID=2058762 RepID=UPI003BAF6B75
MNKEFRHTVLSTLMVAVLAIQQLFGAYHMFIFHANDFEQDQANSDEWVSSSEDACDICAKLNPTPAVHTAETYSPDHGSLCFRVPESKSQLSSIVGHYTNYRRGPPSPRISLI